MIFQRFFAPSPSVLAGRALFMSASEKARDPDFYTEAGVPDTYEGRFELYTLHVVLLLHRLKGDEPGLAETRQGLFDAFVRNLDDGLREMGVGDLSVGKKMRKLGAGVYGRLKSYDMPLNAADANALVPLLTRTVYADSDSDDAPALAQYVIAANRSLVTQSTQAILQGEARWPPFSS